MTKSNCFLTGVDLKLGGGFVWPLLQIVEVRTVLLMRIISSVGLQAHTRRSKRVKKCTAAGDSMKAKKRTLVPFISP